MAPTLVREPFHRPGWVYEEKIHGRSAATRGYVAKDEERFYVSGRTRAWLKVRCRDGRIQRIDGSEC